MHREHERPAPINPAQITAVLEAATAAAAAAAAAAQAATDAVAAIQALTFPLLDSDGNPIETLPGSTDGKVLLRVDERVIQDQLAELIALLRTQNELLVELLG